MSQLTTSSTLLTSSFTTGLITQDRNSKRILSGDEKLKLLKREMKDAKKEQKAKKLAWADEREELASKTKSSVGKIENTMLSSSLLKTSSLTKPSLRLGESGKTGLMKTSTGSSRSRSKSPSARKSQSAVKSDLSYFASQNKQPSYGGLSTNSSLLSSSSLSTKLNIGSSISTSGNSRTLSHLTIGSKSLASSKDTSSKLSGLKLTISLGSKISSSSTGTIQTSLAAGNLCTKGSLLTGGTISEPSKYGAIGSHLGKTSTKPSLNLTSSLLQKNKPQIHDQKKPKISTGMKKSKLVKGKKEHLMRSESTIDPPQYEFSGADDVKGIEIPEFVPPECEVAILKMNRPVHDVLAMKNGLINAVSASLIRAPDFKQTKDPFRIELLAVVEQVSLYDSEFILKLALYTRNELNIRTTANFLLASAANIRTCRPYLRKYYDNSIRLPSDWIDVAEQYQAFHDKNLQFGSLPAALRRVMVQKFPRFDKYQLGKYNKENAAKKKRKKANKAAAGRGRGRGRGRGGSRGRGNMRGGYGRGSRINFEADSSSSSESSSDEEDEDESDAKHRKPKRQISGLSEQSDNEEEIARLSFTLKQLIRKLHITEPVEHVMCLIGKKYPETLEDFYRSRLPGTFEEERAGKRMKLPTPETWETQVSLKGNKAETWQDLIDHKKLPFMAMLRNLRNMIKAGISDKHHSWVLKKLTDEGAVINSRQFPFRFFSAYEVLDQLEIDFHTNQSEIIRVATELADGSSGSRGGRGRGRGVRGRGGRGRGGNRGGTGLPDEVKFDVAMINRYRKALDQAVKIATLHNVKPIKGNTLIFVNLGSAMNKPCTAAKGLGAPRRVCEVGTLLGLMCKYSCEECKLIVYGNKTELEVELEKGTILNNMSSVLGLQSVVNGFEEIGEAHLHDNQFMALLRDRIQLDNLIVLSTGMNKYSQEGTMLKDFLCKYRRVVNPNLLFVSVNLSGKATGIDSSVQPGHDNDIHIAGYSDQILRFIAERGDSGQLIHVENIDKAYNLKAMPQTLLEKPDKDEQKKAALEMPISITSFTPRWRTARVFISSTFRDMHGERDLLTRFVFPELRARAAKKFINVFEVDLRWGVTEEMSRNNQAVELCLSEVSKCHYFVGLLGERYGWVPDKKQIPDTPEFDWVREYSTSASITELEFYSGALARPEEKQSKAFIYLRDNTFMKDVPPEVKKDFEAENEDAFKRMLSLKIDLIDSGLEVYSSYPCKWGGVNQGRPLVTGLEDLGNRVLNNLWTAIQNDYKEETSVLDEWEHTTEQHKAYMESHQDSFVGRKKLIANCMQIVRENSEGGKLVAIVGKPGSGKTALLASFVRDYVLMNPGSGLSVLTHFIGAAPGSANINATLRRLNHELCRRFALDHKPAEEYKNVVPQFDELLQEAAKDMLGYPLLVVIDGLDMFDDAYQAQNLQWLPGTVPKNVIIMMSVQENGTCHKALKNYRPIVVDVGTLDMWDKTEVVRTTLAKHRKKLEETPFNNQMKLLTSKKEATNPFYLKLACEEMRVYGLFEKINTKLKSLPHTVPLLLQEILTRLEYDHGATMIGTAFGFLACSRGGLYEDDLYHLLSYSQILVWKQFVTVEDILNIQLGPEQMIPRVLFEQLLRSLQGFLIPNNSQESAILTLSHKEVASAAVKRYIVSIDQEKSIHQLLAGHYWKKADPDRNSMWTGKHKPAFAHLPHHLACGSCYELLEIVLCDLRFLQTKCVLGLTQDLPEDYLGRGLSSYKASERESQKFQKKQAVQTYQKFISSNLHILRTHPGLLWQQALNEPEGSLPQTAVIKLLEEEKSEKKKLMEVLNKPRQTNPCIYTISNMPELVTCLEVSQDNKILAAGSKDCLVHIYDLETGKETLTLTGHSDQVTSVCFVGTNKLCSASADTNLSLWDLDIGHRLKVMKGHSRHVGSCSANKKAEFIVSSGWDRKLKVWKGRNGEFLYDLKGDHSPMNCVTWHPDDSLIAVGYWDCTIRIWDVFNKTRRAVLRGHTTSVRDLAYSPSGRHIASASLDGEVKLWASNNGAQVGTLSGHALPINRLAFSPLGSELITVSDDHKVKVWSGHLGQIIGDMGQEENGPAVSISLHPEGEMVAVGYHEGFMRVYDIVSGLIEFEVCHHKASIRALTYEKTITNEEGSECRLFSGSDDCTMKMLSSQTGKVLVSFTGHTKSILSITVSAHYIVSTSEDISTCVYRLPYSFKPTTVIKPTNVLRGHEGPVTNSAINTNETMLVTASRDMSLMFWELDDLSQPFKVIKGAHMDWINGCSWSESNDFLVTCSNDFSLKLWDTKNYKEKMQMTGHMSAVNSVAYSYGCIVSCSCEGVVKVWSHKGTEITSIHGHTQRVNACDIRVEITRKQALPEVETTTDWATIVAEDEWTEKHDKTKLDKKDITVDDVVIASCSDDGTIQLWRPREGNEICCLTGHSDRVSCVTATSKSQICTGSLDHTLKVWQPEPTLDAEKQANIRHKGEISAFAYDAKRKIILTGSRDGMVKVWVAKHHIKHPECDYTIKAHKKAVTGLCFVGKEGEFISEFASCSEDASVKLWRIGERKHSLVAKLVRTIHTGNVPVSGLHCYTHKRQNQLPQEYLLITDWEGMVTSLRISEAGSVIKKTRKVREDHWVMCSSIADNGKLYFGGTLEEEQPMNITIKELLGDAGTTLSPSFLEPITFPGNAHVNPYKRQPNWLTAVATYKNYVCFGDVNGQLTLIKATAVEEKVLWSKQVHSAGVTDVAITGGFIFSASKDGTLKVWNYNQEQIGQYFAPSPITKMYSCYYGYGDAMIFAGDLLGNITFLKWRST